MWIRPIFHNLLLLILQGIPVRAAPIPMCQLLNNACACTSEPDQQRPTVRCSFTLPLDENAKLLSDSSSDTPEFSLDTVDLTGNDLNSLPEDFFQRVENVSNLLLVRNNFTEISPAILRLKSVLFLDLSHNSLPTLQNGRLNAIPNLQVLNLSHNKLTSLSQNLYDVAETLENLQTLALPTNFQYMEVLNLSYNAIEDIANDYFKSMGHLTILDLSHNRLTEIGEHTFHTLKFSLAALNLSHNALVKMELNSLQHLSHLRKLGLAYNMLGDMSQLEFPPHLETLDLRHCALTDLNHCQLSTLTDLANIMLGGNDLQCSCQLYLLFTWYQTQHHIDFDPSASLNWTCTMTANMTSDTTTSFPGADHTDSWVGHEMLVSNMTGCEDTESHCHTLDHLEHHKQGSSALEVTLNVVSSGMNIMATWTLEENGEVAIDGFRLSYLPEDDDPIYSPIMPHEQNSYTITRNDMQKHFRVCLDVLASEMVIVRQVCQMFKDEPSNVVVGILAGVIFLVPCVTAIVWIIIKDHSIGKTVGYRVLGEATADEKSSTENETNSQKSLEKTNGHTSSLSAKDDGKAKGADSVGTETVITQDPPLDVCTVQIQEAHNQGNTPAEISTNGAPVPLNSVGPDETISTPSPRRHLSFNGISAENDTAQDTPYAPTAMPFPPGVISIYPAVPTAASVVPTAACDVKKPVEEEQTRPVAKGQSEDEAALTESDAAQECGIDNPVFVRGEEYINRGRETTHL